MSDPRTDVEASVRTYLWKGILISFFSWILLIIFLICAIYNHSTESSYFLNLITSIQSLSISSISFVGVLLLGYFYLLSYLEKWGMYIFIDQSNGAREGTSVFMAYRTMTYLLPFLILYLVIVNRDVLGSGILIILSIVTFFVIKPLITNLKNIMLNYKALEALEAQEASAFNGSIGSILKQIMSNNSLISKLRHAVPQAYNVLAALPLIIAFIAFPYGINPIVIIYAILTILVLFLTYGVAFGNVSKNKVNVFLKNGKIYENMYMIAASPKGDFEYLNNNNEVIHIQGKDIEKELLSRPL